jgi:hypothetical protein
MLLVFHDGSGTPLLTNPQFERFQLYAELKSYSGGLCFDSHTGDRILTDVRVFPHPVRYMYNAIT